MRASLTLLIFSAALLAKAEQPAAPAPAPVPAPAPATPKPIAADERAVDVRLAFERLRAFPRPGDIQNAGILANIGDVFDLDDNQRAAIRAARQAYDDEVVKKAAQWETEMKALRAASEVKILASLPAAKRETGAKLLNYSHDQWTTPLEIEARLRGEFIDKKLSADKPRADADEADAARKEFQKWVKTESQKVRSKDAETVAAIKAMLTADEILRLEKFDRNRSVGGVPKAPLPNLPR
jgi:Spy/CpxP family protein refolding chaperone